MYLGIANKKEIVTETLAKNGVSVCCLQETEIPTWYGYPEEILNTGNYNLELEINTEEKRIGMYVRKYI